MNTILSFILALAMFSVSSCGTKNTAEPAPTVTPSAQTAASDVDKSDPVHIKIVLEDGREMKADLYPHVAPLSVENFVKLVNEKFYDGMIFHRCIDGFMIQGGGYDKTFYDGNFNQKETDSIKGEFKQNGVENNLKHTRGVLSMARTQAPDSASSQFFIMHKDTSSLDGQYAAFGELTDGFDVLDEIASGETKDLNGKLTYQGQEYDQTMNDVPANPIVIKTIEIVK